MKGLRSRHVVATTSICVLFYMWAMERTLSHASDLRYEHELQKSNSLLERVYPYLVLPMHTRTALWKLAQNHHDLGNPEQEVWAATELVRRYPGTWHGYYGEMMLADHTAYAERRFETAVAAYQSILERLGPNPASEHMVIMRKLALVGLLMIYHESNDDVRAAVLERQVRAEFPESQYLKRLDQSRQ